MPRRRPRGDHAFADGQRIVGHQRLLGDLVHAAESVTRRTGALNRVRREVLGVEHWLLRRIRAGARVQHAHEARQRGDTADRRACTRRATLLLECDRGRQAFDGIDFRHADLFDEPPRVGRDGFEIASLGFGVQRAERERRFAGARHAGEHDERVARNIDVDVFQIVLARATDADEAGHRVGRAVGRRSGAVTGSGHVGDVLGWRIRRGERRALREDRTDLWMLSDGKCKALDATLRIFGARCRCTVP